MTDPKPGTLECNCHLVRGGWNPDCPYHSSMLPKPDTHEAEAFVKALLENPHLSGALSPLQQESIARVLTALSEERKRAERAEAKVIRQQYDYKFQIRMLHYDRIEWKKAAAEERQKRQEAQARAERYRAAALALKKACGKAVRDSDEIAESYQDLGRVWDEAERELADVQQKLRTVEKALKQATNRPWDER